ncbi:sensor histidine kinase [Amphibacillus xylanus]|uniref:Heme sensor protein HssS n=1 Tax=Amphibacillus xylanus (strain ATCC 51415 / DSM 6626 / JCM 7361 / LMG 17667 / NBRC 15112 / Ep01) TaxID=698758 RepID=K0J6P2_AMPXN|nr:HAMP domain-containing sensor histidine kinase [Amphibacillus xylanus]BAM46788.1 two-component system sensor histidine kinase [Amphibacillus xylanus NBRC 15112]
MRNSLYWKFVVAFIVGVIVSLFGSFIFSSRFIQEDVILESEMGRVSQYVKGLLQIVDQESIPELVELFNQFGIDPVLTDLSGQPIISDMIADFVTDDMIVQIQQLQPNEVISFASKRQDATRYIGTRLSNIEGAEALFIKLDLSSTVKDTRRLTMQTLMLVLCIGSLLILLLSRYFVDSIRSITKASEKLATGDFSTRLPTDRQDELGRLMHSFNNMAEALENMEEVRKQFISNISHEMQSPLTSIKGYAGALRDGLVSEENQQDYLDIIYQEVDRLSRLSNNLLKMASLDAEKDLIKLETYRLDEQIRRVILSIEPLWREKNISVELDLSKTYIYANQDLMEQVWLNLIVNAIKYNRENGEIYISFYKDDQDIVVRINDTGIGIDQKDIPYLFDRFYKVDRSRSEFSSGNGLGLSITKKIIQIHNGSIDLVSQKGIGTTFFVRLPIQ